MAPQQAADGSKNQCQMVHRAMLAATTSGGGTIRLRDGDYISPPIVLGPRTQLVNFPLPRPGITPAEDVVVIEGNATDVVRNENSDPGRRSSPPRTGNDMVLPARRNRRETGASLSNDRCVRL